MHNIIIQSAKRSIKAIKLSRYCLLCHWHGEFLSTAPLIFKYTKIAKLKILPFFYKNCISFSSSFTKLCSTSIYSPSRVFLLTKNKENRLQRISSQRRRKIKKDVDNIGLKSIFHDYLQISFVIKGRKIFKKFVKN